ncbi:MAG: hypothetical protein ACK5MT_11285 [Actinomycetales bacterium]
MSEDAPDVGLWFDPVCPFCWMTSKWLRSVAERRGLTVDWRFISLRLLNSHVDYDAHFPPEYEAQHTAGLRMLRVAAAVREGEGRAGVDALQRAFGEAIFEQPPPAEGEPPSFGAPEMEQILTAAGLPVSYAEALDDLARDEVIQAETDEALRLTGKDVGTPIIQLDPPQGPSLFGPVISRLPEPAEAVELWEHVVALARFPGFAELKRSLRERPQLPAFGVLDGQAGQVEDWHQGSRRQKK